MYNNKKYGRYSRYPKYNKYRNKRYTKVSKGLKNTIKTIVKKEVGSEIKYHTKTVTVGTGYVADVGNITYSDVCDVSQGLADSERVGDNVKIKAMWLKIKFSPNAGYTHGAVRLLVFQWHTDMIIQAPSSPLLLMSSISGGIDALSHYNEDSKTSGAFTVLYDKMYTLALGPSGDDPTVVDIKIPLKYCKKQISYTSGQTYGRDHICLGVLSDKASSGTDSVNVSFTSRIFFTDN